MTSTPAFPVPGPPALGRGVVLADGDPVPAAFHDVPRVPVDADVLAAPRATAAVLRDHWVRRRPVVVVLAVDPRALREPQVDRRPAWELPDDLAFDREDLHGLIWANTYDARGGREPVWWHGVLAHRRGAALSAVADVRVPRRGADLRRSSTVGDNAPPRDPGRARSRAADDRAPRGASDAPPRGDHDRDLVDAWVDGGPRGPVGDLALVHRESVALGRPVLAGTGPPTVDLSADQLAAVTHPAGPARVIAPAGSGKTRVLTARLRHLLEDRHVEPELVTAVAYNTRAAEELRERLADVPAASRASIRTIHSLALWVCNLDDRREVIDERRVRSILHDLVRPARIPNQDPLQPYLEALSEVRIALRPPAEVEAVRDDVDDLPTIVTDYRAILARDRLLDFDEQLFRAIELLTTDPELRARVQRRCTHLLVDEFQDLTPAYLLLLRLAAGWPRQVFGVGDDDQVIYSYAGATPDYLVDFDRWFPGAAHHAITVNHRCPAPVVDAARTLLTHNRHRVDKVIEPARPGAGDPPRVHRVDTDAMASRIVDTVRSRLAAGAAPTAIAVLARVNSALLPAQVALAEAGIATTAPLDATVLGRTGIRTALAYLRIGLDPERIRREDLHETLRRPPRKLTGALTPLLRRSGTWSLERLAAAGELLEGRYADRLGDYVADLTAVVDAVTRGADTATCLRLVRDRIGLGEAMATLDSSRTRPEGSSHGDDLDALDALAALHPDVTTFREWLVEHLRRGGARDGVTLSTVHRVKGREWDHVVVAAVNAGLLPHRLADDVEEERRVLHVALTRCRRDVVVLASRTAPSPFLDELTRPAPHPTAAAVSAADVAPRSARRTDAGVVAEVGAQVVLAGGHPAIVTAVEGDRVDLRIRPAGPALTLWLGDEVVVDGDRVPLTTPPRAAVARAGTRAAATSAADDAMFEVLREWRTRTAREHGLPAYVVLHDAALRAIAASRPRDLRELAACPGIGPTKLDRYGDDLLALVDAAG